MKKIYISDLDGTLLRNNGTISEYSKQKLIELLNNGLDFTVASARSVVAIQSILKDIPLKLPVIEVNGAYISDFKTGRHQVVNSIAPEVVQEIYRLASSYNFKPFLSVFNGSEDCLYYQEIQNEGMDWYFKDRTSVKDRRLRKTFALDSVLSQDIVCFTIIDKEDKLIEIMSLLKEQLSNEIEIHFMENFYSPGWYWLTINDKKASKDQAIKLLIDDLGLSSDNLVVFGDNSNDEKMFKLASKGVAVENAKDSLKSYAAEIIGSNEDDSVVKYIARDFCLKD